MKMTKKQKTIFLVSEGDRWYLRNENASDVSDHVDHLILNHVRHGKRILEVGCADGRRLNRIQKNLSDESKLVGIDPSSTAVSAGKSKYNLDLRIGTADQLPQNENFDIIIIGFCLYICDQSDLPKIVSEIDRVLEDRGLLIVIDFDPPSPRRRGYRHAAGIWSHKMDYSTLFTAFPAYTLESKHSFSHSSSEPTEDPTERLGMWILRKDLTSHLPEEMDT